MTRTTPRMGRAVERLLIEHFDTFRAAQSLGERNVWLALAKIADDPLLRKQRIGFAKDAHRSMMARLRDV